MSVLVAESQSALHGLPLAQQDSRVICSEAILAVSSPFNLSCAWLTVSLGLKVDSLLVLESGTVECASIKSPVLMVGANGILSLSGIFIVVSMTCGKPF
jgi:hypothetical protein